MEATQLKPDPDQSGTTPEKAKDGRSIEIAVKGQVRRSWELCLGEDCRAFGQTMTLLVKQAVRAFVLARS